MAIHSDVLDALNDTAQSIKVRAEGYADRFRRWRRGPRHKLPSDRWLEDNYVTLADVLEEEYESMFGPFPDGAVARDSEASRVRSFYSFLHSGQAHRRFALCLSGGGIRSATFALGVLQGLARHGILQKFSYLSTVSGGGFIGGWLTAWIRRHPAGVRGVVDALSRQPASPLQPEPPVIERLRDYSNYLTPRYGLLSADTWTLIGIYLRNLTINWAVLLPALAALLMLPRIAIAAVGTQPWPMIPEVLWYSSIALGVWSLVVMRASVPTGTPVAAHALVVTGDNSYFVKCLLPLMIASTFLMVLWAWAPENKFEIVSARVLQYVPNLSLTTAALASVPLLSQVKQPWWPWSLVAAAINLTAWAVYYLAYVRPRGYVLRSVLRDVTAGLFAGIVGGWLFYVAADHWRRNGLVANPLVGDPLYVAAGPAIFLGVFLIAGTAYIAWSSRDASDYEREWYARSGAWLLITGLAWLVFSSIVIAGPILLLHLGSKYKMTASFVTVASGLFTILGGRSARSSSAGGHSESNGWTEFLMNRGLSVAAPIFLVVIISALSLITSRVMQIRVPVETQPLKIGAKEITDWGRHVSTLDRSTPFDALLFTGLFAAVAFVIARRADLNVFSLHGMYRDRLIRAYLAASRQSRHPNAFTGFDPADNLPLHHARPGMFTREDAPALHAALREPPHTPLARFVHEAIPNGVHEAVRNRAIGEEVLAEQIVQAFNDVLAMPELARFGDPNVHTTGYDLVHFNRTILAAEFAELAEVRTEDRAVLFPVINVALNLVRGQDLAWQQRKAESFILTPLHAGAPTIQFRRIQWRGGRSERNLFYGGVRGVSLGTAMTISGAAANPNMGYHSSPVITFLLTLFNARLGAWLGNPQHGAASARQSPTPKSLPIVAEALGWTDSRHEFVNLSDGGHFDNLGLYEMVRRRCRLIVVVDAGQDKDFKFEDLGNAISKIRVDFGIPIVFDEPIGIRSHTSPSGIGRRAAIGRIRYGCVDPNAREGILLYVKPAIAGTEPVDVLHYSKQNPEFPHQPTTDQWFSEVQLESYRVLGSFTVDEILGEQPSRNMFRALRQVYRYCGAAETVR